MNMDSSSNDAMGGAEPQGKCVHVQYMGGWGGGFVREVKERARSIIGQRDGELHHFRRIVWGKPLILSEDEG